MDDEGRDVVNWPAAADAAIDEYIKTHSGDASVLDSTFVYQGAFSVGVKRVKFLSLFSLILTSVGGPLLVIGEQAATMGQWAVAAAVVFFGTSTTGLLHIITSPYVISLRRIADGSFEVTTAKCPHTRNRTHANTKRHTYKPTHIFSKHAQTPLCSIVDRLSRAHFVVLPRPRRRSSLEASRSPSLQSKMSCPPLGPSPASL